MGVRILHDSDQNLAVLYCSTSDFAFGPVFSDNRAEGRDADERVQSFLRFCATTDKWSSYEKAADFGGRDPRQLTDAGIERAYGDWLAQEASQWKAEEAKDNDAAEA